LHPSLEDEGARLPGALADIANVAGRFAAQRRTETRSNNRARFPRRAPFRTLVGVALAKAANEEPLLYAPAAWG
jgi:hypothetical protein